MQFLIMNVWNQIIPYVHCMLDLVALSKGIHDVSFNRPASRGSFGQSPLPTTDVINQLNCSLEQSLNQSWIFYNYTATPSAPSHISTTGSSSYASNPNKAVITINARTTEVRQNEKTVLVLLHTTSSLLSERECLMFGHCYCLLSLIFIVFQW